jgi:four helix bundle protein
MGNHRDLLVWQRASAFAGRIDAETRRMARGHGELADQLRRAALSVPTNLAEGASKGRDSEFLRFIGISIGSAAELDSLLAHAAAVGACDRQTLAGLTDDLTVIRKMLFKLRGALQRSGDGHTLAASLHATEAEARSRASQGAVTPEPTPAPSAEARLTRRTP